MSDVDAPACFDPWPNQQVHVEWGTLGAGLAAERGDAVVVVDVLSFSTTLDIAVARDFTCHVYSAAEIDARGGLQAAADRLGVRPLSKRRRMPPGQISLSPSSLLRAEPGQQVLFTSLNGAAVAAAATPAPAMLVGCLRNATACGRAVARLLASGSAARVTMIACGEQWSSTQPCIEGLRPSLEDWIGVGLISDRLAQAGHTLSAEATAAATVARSLDPDLLASCVSARELAAAGFADDVELAMQVDASDTVPTRVASEPSGRVFTAACARHQLQHAVPDDDPGRH